MEVAARDLDADAGPDASPTRSRRVVHGMFSSRPQHLKVRILPSRQQFSGILLSYPQHACRHFLYSGRQKGTSSSQRKWVALGGLGAGVVVLAASIWNLRHSRELPLRPLSPEYFSPVSITESRIIGKDTRLINLKLPPEVLQGVTNACPIWSVYVKNSDIQIERPYTPLNGLSESGSLALWIKSYPDGEMGRWMHSRPLGENIEIRGPEQTWNCQFEAWDNIVMVIICFSYILLGFTSVIHQIPRYLVEQAWLLLCNSSIRTSIINEAILR